MQQTSAAKIKSQKTKNGIFYLIYLLLLVYFVLELFYLFESGTPQFSDFILLFLIFFIALTLLAMRKLYYQEKYYFLFL